MTFGGGQCGCDRTQRPRLLHAQQVLYCGTVLQLQSFHHTKDAAGNQRAGGSEKLITD